MAPVSNVESLASPPKSRILLNIKCLKCNKIVRNGILCDMCDQWHHFRCAGTKESELPDENSDWKCPTCRNSMVTNGDEVDVVGESVMKEGKASLAEVVTALQLELSHVKGENNVLRSLLEEIDREYANTISSSTRPTSDMPSSDSVSVMKPNTRGWESVPIKYKKNLPNQIDKKNFHLEQSNRFSILSQVDDDGPMPLSIPSKRQQISKNTSSNKPKTIHIYSDSHGRGLSKFITQNHNFKVHSSVKPNANFEAAASGSNPTKEDDEYNVFIAGTNDVARNEKKELLRALRKKLDCMRFNSIVFSVPQRHDLPSWSCVNIEIGRANKDIAKLCKYFKNVHFVDLSKLGKRFHTVHGLHLNRLGKLYVTNKIIDIVTKSKVELLDKPIEMGFLG